MPTGKLVKIGAWENGKFVGCVLFGRGATPNLLKQYGLTQYQGCELVRIAFTKHVTEISRIIAIAIKFLKKHCPELKLIVSFADKSQNHHGGIYQAANWIYSGCVNLDSWMINGKKMHPKSVVVKYGTRSEDVIKKIDSSAYKIWGMKHRYLMPLDDVIKKQIEYLRKPYPKRIEHENNAPVTLTGEGGAVPTDALHLNAKE